MMMMLQWILLSNWNHLSSLHVQMADTKSISFNLLDSKGNYNATSSNMKLVHWLLMDGLLHLVQEGGAWAGCGPAQSLLYDGRCSVVYVAIKGLRYLYYCYVVTMTAGEEFVFLSLYAGLFVTFHL